MLYFDHNSTTPLAPEVSEVYLASLCDVYGNPSSTHGPGQLARQCLEQARRTIANALSVSPVEVVFTSGGTEANNLAILGSLRDLPRSAHIITTVLEHPAVLEPCRQLEREGFAVTYAPNAAAVPAAIREDTVLVSVMHANNETGALQPISEIAQFIAARRQSGQPIFFHSDGVQAFGKILVTSVPDLYSISAHKIHGPRGIGALIVRKGTPLQRILFGGRHERERRPGTENVPAALAFARAVELPSFNVAPLRDYFETSLLSCVPGIEINAAASSRLPNTSNILFHGISAEALVIALDMRGMAVSTGAACSSGSVEPSHVLLAMGLTRDQARSSVRFSFGRSNTMENVRALVDAVVASVGKLRNREARLAG